LLFSLLVFENQGLIVVTYDVSIPTMIMEILPGTTGSPSRR
jgi:hypothetical protein